MKVEKINDNKIRITLTFEELEKRKINIDDIEENSEIAKNLFTNLLEETNINKDFKLEGEQLLIEATSDNKDLFIVTITKVYDLPNVKEYMPLKRNIRKLKKSNTKSKKIKEDFEYEFNGSIYFFNSFDDILTLCKKSRNEKMFWGKNSLYKYNGKYLIIFEHSSIRNKKFEKTFSILTEYCDKYYSSYMLDFALKEKSELLIKNSALQTLNKFKG